MPDRSKSNLKIKQKKKQDQKRKSILTQRKNEIKQSLQNVDLIIGIDNGSTGTICSWVIKNNKINFLLTPSKRELNYQKQIKYIDRIDHQFMINWIKDQIKYAQKLYKSEIKVILILQRPMVNPQRFDASLNAVRAFEAILIIIEQLNLKYIVIDSKEWQHYFFGKDTALLNLKLESKKYGIKTINQFKKENKNYAQYLDIIESHGDADALLITKYGKEKLIKFK